MQINWYPGHMTKSKRMIEEMIGLVDAVIYVLDARAPRSCQNPDFDRIIGGLPIIYVLNKSDLADPNETERWLRFFKEAGSTAVALTGTLSGSANGLPKIIASACSYMLMRSKKRGINKSVRAMVLGVPNSGKSTLVNSLCGKGKAITGNRPGVTRGKQWVKINDELEVLDTPGTLYPKLTDQTVARHLCYIGSIKEDVVDIEELAYIFLKEMLEREGDHIFSPYQFVLPSLQEREEVIGWEQSLLEQYGRRRGFVQRGNAIDMLRAARAFMEDFRKGKMGRITLDKAERDGQRDLI